MPPVTPIHPIMVSKQALFFYSGIWRQNLWTEGKNVGYLNAEMWFKVNDLKCNILFTKYDFINMLPIDVRQLHGSITI